MKRKLLWPALWLLMGCLSLAPALLPTPADAMAPIPSITTYYSDAAHTTIVGRKIVGCNGTVSQTGAVTQFSTFRILECA